MSDTIVVRSFPSDDCEFANHVRAAAEALVDVPPDQLERCLGDVLRQTFPGVVVRRISDLGANQPSRLTWYVFRHGSPEPPERTPRSTQPHGPGAAAREDSRPDA